MLMPSLARVCLSTCHTTVWMPLAGFLSHLMNGALVKVFETLWLVTTCRLRLACSLGHTDPHCLTVLVLQVLIAGSEATLDYRVQIYTPAYLQTGGARPTMSGAPTSVTYGATFTVDFAGVDSITRVTMIRQSAVTHSIHMDARQVSLEIESVTAGTVTVTAPPDATIAPPGNYMLFILYNGIPSVANWVSVA